MTSETNYIGYLRFHPYTPYLIKNENNIFKPSVYASHMYRVTEKQSAYTKKGVYLGEFEATKRYNLCHSRTLDEGFSKYYHVICYNWKFYLIQFFDRVWTIDEVHNFHSFIENTFKCDVNTHYNMPEITFISGNSMSLYSRKYKSVIDFDYDKLLKNKDAFLKNFKTILHERDHNSITNKANELFSDLLKDMSEYFLCSIDYLKSDRFDLTNSLIKRLHKNINRKSKN